MIYQKKPFFRISLMLVPPLEDAFLWKMEIEKINV